MRKHLKTKPDLWRKLKERNKECAHIGGMSGEEFESMHGTPAWNRIMEKIQKKLNKH